VEELRPDPHSGQLRRFSLELKQQVVGQRRALDKLTDSLSQLLAGIQDPQRPLLTMLFMGPTGVGKTETVRALARILFGNPRAFTRINCQEYAAQFNVSKLLGSPPGYVGGEIKPLLSQDNLDRHYLEALNQGTGLVSADNSLIRQVIDPSDDQALALVLFDEIEKAHPKVWDLLLGILEDGTVTLGNNEEADFRRALIILTTNVGSQAMGLHLGRETIGFSPGDSDDALTRDIEHAARRAARKVFPFEFLNRFDEILTFHPLGDEELMRILDLRVAEFHRRTLTCPRPFLIQLTGAARIHLIEYNADPALGARPVNRAMAELIVTPLSHFVVQGKLDAGDLIVIDFRADELRFLRHKAGHGGTAPPAEGGPPAVRWIAVQLGVGDDSGEKEDITEEVHQAAAEATAGASGAQGGDEPWAF